MAARITIDSMAPIGWTCYISGQYYKVGKFNRIFVFRFNEWISTSGVTLSEIEKHVKLKSSDVAAPSRKREYVNAR